MFYVNFSVKPLNFAQMVNFLFLAYFGGHFDYHSNGKSQGNLRHLHLGYCTLVMSVIFSAIDGFI